MPVSWQLYFFNLVTFVFLYVCTPSPWAIYAHSCPWHVWKAQTDFGDLSVGFVYISSWWLRLFILDRNSTEIPFLSLPLLLRRYMMISWLMYSGVDCECFSGVWSTCSDCVHILFCNKTSTYFKINRDGFYLTLSAVKSDTNVIVCILLSERIVFLLYVFVFHGFFISAWTLEFFFYSVYYISSW